jgi:alpha-tubulin suppressor-like RCC1 family protein
MTSSNYQTNAVDLDSTYIPGNDPNYQGIQAAVTNRKTVVFGQQLLTQTYPVGNLNGAINYAQSLPGIQVDQDSTTITGVGPTAVFYQSRANAQSLIRANFLLAENYPQTTDWQVGVTARSSPVQVGTSSNWTAVSTGSYNTGAIQNPTNSNLWMWGLNDLGQLGQSNTTNRSSPVQVNGILWGWSQLTVGQGVTLALLSNGSLWTWGGNTYGQLGVGSIGTNILSPVQIGALSTWTRISAGNYFAFALKNDGTLWSWGNNSNGQLGINTSTLSAISNPVQSGTVSTWTQVSCGYNFTMAIQSNGTLWAWGRNNASQLGLGDITDRSSPAQIGALSTWSRISSGNTFTAAIQSNGTLWTWGNNLNGQLGVNTNIVRISSPVQVGALSTWTQVACGYSILALQTPGTLWSWGYNVWGQLGQSDTTNRSSPVQVGALSTWTKISAGNLYSTAIQSNGTLWSWGNNSFGQLGLNPSGIPVNKQAYGL